MQVLCRGLSLDRSRGVMQWRLWRLKPALEISVKIVLPPLEFTELHRLPPSRNRTENRSNYQLPPPRIYGTSSRLPLPQNRAENRSNYQLPPLEFTELHRLPPLEIGPKTAPTTPLEFTELHRLPPSKYSRSWVLSIVVSPKPALPNNSHDATGPFAYVINASDLRALHALNKLNKYADDSYLIVPSINSQLVREEFDHISTWAFNNNLMLNVDRDDHQTPQNQDCISPSPPWDRACGKYEYSGDHLPMQPFIYHAS